MTSVRILPTSDVLFHPLYPTEDGHDSDFPDNGEIDEVVSLLSLNDVREVL
jgi:hypothetical protein